jgi:hypothetical protein
MLRVPLLVALHSRDAGGGTAEHLPSSVRVGFEHRWQRIEVLLQACNLRQGLGFRV